MPTKPDGALGSLDYTKEERRALAIKSRLAAPKFGNAERQALIDEVWRHSTFLLFNCVMVHEKTNHAFVCTSYIIIF